MADLKPFFPFFGSKWRTVPHYPAPADRLIIEPFAGSAAYATWYPDHRVLLIDRDPVIVAVWKYLIRAKPSEIVSIPDIQESVDEIVRWPEEVRWLVGFWLCKGNPRPNLRLSAWGRTGLYPNQFWGEAVRRRLAGQVDRIRHWKIQEGRHDSAPAIRASWFVDPPYRCTAGRRYKGGHKGLDYPEIGAWCQRLRGLVIVCEQAGADWLPFRPFRRTKASHATAWSEEVIWTRREAQQMTFEEIR